LKELLVDIIGKCKERLLPYESLIQFFEEIQITLPFELSKDMKPSTIYQDF
jgi:hypothetical protein